MTKSRFAADLLTEIEKASRRDTFEIVEPVDTNRKLYDQDVLQDASADATSE